MSVKPYSLVRHMILFFALAPAVISCTLCNKIVNTLLHGFLLLPAIDSLIVLSSQTETMNITLLIYSPVLYFRPCLGLWTGGCSLGVRAWPIGAAYFSSYAFVSVGSPIV